MTTPSILDDIERAVAALKNGGVIAMPTDTLYALIACASDDAAVRRVYAVKGREADKPLPLFVRDMEMADRIGVVNDVARRLMLRFWPGALTIVLPKRERFYSLALAGGDTVAVRSPANIILLGVLEGVHDAFTATSANRSGGPDPTTADEVLRQLGEDVDLVIDAGRCNVGIASTIVDCTTEEPRIIRAGAIDEAKIAAALRR